MSKFFNNTTTTNNAAINQTPVDQEGSKLGWIKTGLLIAGGAAATIGAAIGAKKLYEEFSSLDGELDSADYPEEDDDYSEEPEESESKIINFNEVDTEPSIFTAANEVVDEPVDEPEVDTSTPKPELDENGNFILPKGKSWNDLVRGELMSNFKDLESYFMSVSDTDMGDPIWVIRSSVSIFNKAASFVGKTAWEDAYIASMREDLDTYLMYSMRGLENRFTDTHRMGDLIYVRRLYDEYLASPFYTYLLGKKMRDILENIERELQKYKALKHSPAPEKDELDEELGSSEDPKEKSEEAPTSDSSVPSTPEDATKTETVASSEQTQKEDSSLEEPVNEPENPEIIDQFKKNMNFLGGLMKSGRYADSQKFFRENLSTYLTDPNVSEETRSALEQVQHQITNFLIAEKQAAAIEEANNGRRKTARKKGVKRNYKKNGRK